MAPLNWQPGKKMASVVFAPLLNPDDLGELACSISRSANSCTDGGMMFRSTICSRANLHSSAIEKSLGQSTSQSPQSEQEFIILLALWVPWTIAKLLYICLAYTFG
jgi:hypothetical protein